MSGGVWPPDGVRAAAPAERPVATRSKPWLEPGYGIRPSTSTTQAFAGVRKAFADLADGFLTLGAAARAARDRMATFTAFRDADRPEQGAPPP